jgi:PTS system nitrogen regulatory IIA component
MSEILAQPFIALGINDRGIPFASGQRNLTDIFFLILSRSDRGHLHTLARVSRLLSDGELLTAFRGAENAAEAYNLIAECEQTLLASE